MVKLLTNFFEFPNFSFEIRPVTGRDFPVTVVTGNPDPLGFFFLPGTKTLG